jgi:antitoxin component of MazEF toxin-antitoxin module
METVIRKIGNSAGLILPAALMRSMSLCVGQEVEVAQAGETLVLKPKANKKFKLGDLLAQCNPRAKPPTDMVSWENVQPVGKEAI